MPQLFDQMLSVALIRALVLLLGGVAADAANVSALAVAAAAPHLFTLRAPVSQSESK